MCQGKCLRTDRVPVPEAALKTPGDREAKGGRLFHAVLVAPRKHWNESQRRQVCSSYSGSQKVLCSRITWETSFRTELQQLLRPLDQEFKNDRMASRPISELMRLSVSVARMLVNGGRAVGPRSRECPGLGVRTHVF